MKNENVILKNWRDVDITFGLIYPNTFQIGMSSYAIRLLYSLLNSYDNIVCERVFLPDNVRYPAKKNYEIERVRSIENQVLLNDFDILGFSLQFENDFRNFLWILENSGIPLTTKERKEVENNGEHQYPLIIAGGPVVTSNPLPFSEFTDLFIIGDFEPIMDPFLSLVNKYKFNKLNLNEFLNRVKDIEGIYVPSLKNQVKRAFLENLDDTKIPIFQLMSGPVEHKIIFENSFFLEINRGCPFQCKFCISSYHNKPFRNRSFENLIDTIDQSIASSTFNKFSLIGSCVSAHPKFIQICDHILKKGKSFSIPSIRIEHLNEESIALLERGGIRTVTIAPETGSESLRYALGKKISNKMIIEVVNKIKNSEIKNIKFYFLIGLPNEEQEDIDETIAFLKQMDQIGFNKNSLRVNINPLIPKLNTPYENEISFLLDEKISILKTRISEVQKQLKNIRSIKLNFDNISNMIKQARLQAFISLADKDCFSLLETYYHEGANFGSLRRAEKLEGISINEYFHKIKAGYNPWIKMINS